MPGGRASIVARSMAIEAKVSVDLERPEAGLQT
jgi:hypothetical protein